MRTKCPNCFQVYKIKPEHVGQTITCKNCKNSFTIEPLPDGKTGNHVNPVTALKTQTYSREQATMKKRFKVEIIKEGALGTLFVGSSKLPIKKMEEVMNRYGAEGWNVEQVNLLTLFSLPLIPAVKAINSHSWRQYDLARNARVLTLFNVVL